MRSRLFALLALSVFAAPCLASRVAYCDPTANPILGRVLAYETSVNTTPELLARHGVDVVIDPDVSALIGIPWHEWKCSGTSVAQMTVQELVDVAAAELAARQAAALASYGQTGCDLVAGDSIIGQCEDGTILTSMLFEDAVADVIKRRLQVADGEYLRRQGNLIVGYPALPSGSRISGTASVAVNGTEQAVTTVVVQLAKSTSRVLLVGRVTFQKDGGTTIREVTARIRRGGDNAVQGVPCTVRSQNVANSVFGPCVFAAVDINPPAPGEVTYGITATLPTGAATAVQYELVAMEVQ